MTVNVLKLFLTLSWVGLQCVIVSFPFHTHLLFRYFFYKKHVCWVLNTSHNYKSLIVIDRNNHKKSKKNYINSDANNYGHVFANFL